MKNAAIVAATSTANAPVDSLKAPPSGAADNSNEARRQAPPTSPIPHNLKTATFGTSNS